MFTEFFKFIHYFLYSSNFYKAQKIIFIMAAFGVDTLGALSEKLKQLINETQSQYESFIETNQLYKQGKINEREFFSRIGDYLVSSSAMNFLTVRVVFEIKNALEKNSSMKNTSGSFISPGSSMSQQSGGFGIGGFVGGSPGGSSISGFGTSGLSSNESATIRPLETDTESMKIENKSSLSDNKKSCSTCGSSIPKKAKFCNKCGNSQ